MCSAAWHRRDFCNRDVAPCDLGVRCRGYDDSLPRDRYLDWTDAWTKAAARAIGPQGSLFLNVGAKPTDPWTALDVAQTARRHLTLQNTIHWIKSIAIDRDAAGASAGLDRDLSVGTTSDRQRAVRERLSRVHLPLQRRSRTPLDRHAIGVPYQDASNVTRWRAPSRQPPLPWQYLSSASDTTIQNRDPDRRPATPARIAGTA